MFEPRATSFPILVLVPTQLVQNPLNRCKQCKTKSRAGLRTEMQNVELAKACCLYEGRWWSLHSLPRGVLLNIPFTISVWCSMWQCSLKDQEGLSSRVTEPAGCTRSLSVKRPPWEKGWLRSGWVSWAQAVESLRGCTLWGLTEGGWT